MVNNQPSVATLSLPLLGGSPADVCGVLHYGANKAAVVSIGFTVSQPAKFANFSLRDGQRRPPVTLPAIPPNQWSRQHSRLAYY